MAAIKLEVLISQLVHKIGTRFRRLMFPGSSNPTEKLRIIRHQTGSGKFKMAASKLRLRISQLVHKIATKFQRLYHCFRGSPIN